MSGRKLGLRLVALGYLAVILVAPLGLVVWRTFADDASGAWSALSNPETVHAFKVTLEAAAIAVPLNTVFGILCGLAIVRRRFPGKGLVNAFVDLPLAISPVVVGLALVPAVRADGLVRLVALGARLPGAVRAARRS